MLNIKIQVFDTDLYREDNGTDLESDDHGLALGLALDTIMLFLSCSQRYFHFS
jgi:hypothetical protein